MKTFFSLITLFLLVIVPKEVFAADPTPSLTNSYCDFSGGGIPGNPTGDVTITTACAVYEDVNGVSEGDLIVDGGVITLHKKLGYSPAGQIDILNSGIVYVNTNGSITQGILCVKDADGDNYADTISVTTDPYGVALTAPITQIEQDIFTTPGCPEGYTSRADVNNLTIADTDFTSVDPAKIATSDRELLRLGFTIGDVTDAQAAATDVQIIDKNLLICTEGVCPTTGFDALTPTTGNIYVAGKVGIGTTSPTERLQVAGSIKMAGASTTDNDSPGLIYSSNDDFLDNGQYINHYGFGFQSYYSTGYVASYMSGWGGLNFYTGGANRMTINQGGNVGIGKTNPSVKLDVTGDLNISGNTNICELKTYTAGSGTVTCTSGYYTWAGVASATGGQMLCCKVNNPI